MEQLTYFLRIESIPMADEKTGKIVAYTHMPHIEPFKTDLKSLQEQVGGYIEHFIISAELEQKGIDMWIDEEGKYKDYHPTFALCDNNGRVLDMIMGNCVFTRFNQSGETYGLTMEDVADVMKWLNRVPFTVVSKHSDVNEFGWVVKGFE